ncbi:MAG: protein kinase [Enhygromyxa sp.]
MDPADAADGKRRTQAWMGPPIEPPASTPARALRWMPNPASLPAYPEAPSQQAHAQATLGSRAPGVIVGDRYRLIRKLGQGALTETWEASHVDLERGVAIKFLRESAIGIAERMVEEARAVARIRHPHVVEFSDFGRTGQGEPFFVMELLTGQTVEQLLARRGVIPWARAVAIVQQVGEALGAAHQHGIVHRDLRPGNVFLVDTGQAGDFIKVVDFGLARGTTLGGTPSYMSPEQCRNEQLDPRSDVYAMGCLLFAMVTGDPPFVGDPQRVIWQQLNEPPRTLRERAPRQFIPDELEAIVARCLAKLPAQRFADTRELAAELATLAQFSAATSVVAPIQDPSASASRPMGFAGRPPPRSPRELTDSYKPVNQPIIDDAPGERRAAPPPRAGMSAPADARIIRIISAVVAGVIAVSGMGLGMYWLVNRLIDEDESAELREQPSEASEGSSARSAEPSKGASEPPSSMAARESSPVEAESAKPEPPPAAAQADAPEPRPEQPPTPAKDSASKPASKPSQPRQAAPSEPSPTPAPQPAPAPAPAPIEEPPPKPPPPKKPKPSAEPDSKAKNQIGHDDLLDPWG